MDLNELRNKLDLLTNENASLHERVNEANQELASKNNQLTQRESQNQELVNRL